MEILISKNEKRVGPYTPTEVQARIASGQLSEADPGWHNGLTDWQPVGRVLSELSSRSNALPMEIEKPSGFAKASFIIAMAGILAWFAILGFAGMSYAAGAREDSPLMIFVGLLMMGCLAANLIGAVFGIAALCRNGSNRWMAVTGLTVNGVEILTILVVLLIGMSK
jgi:GYF domain 2